MRNRVRLFAALNILVPLIIGLAVYFAVQKSTYLERVFAAMFAVDFKPLVWSGWTYTFTVCWLCDVLWSYSLVFSLWVSLYSRKNAVLLSVVLALFAGVAFELLQLFGQVGGTFDVFDIIMELTAAILAAVVIKRRKLI
ncbi:MAG: hypothetical protein IKT37_03170 [Clostridia bacterium]|nr:hypothetical protein [Clostridia bacterium]